MQDSTETVGLSTAVGKWDDRSAVAVIGVSCRFPGASDPQAYWDLLREGRDAIGAMPAARWGLGGLAPEAEDASTEALARRGGFIDDVDRFDARFFEISAHEADAMDPQQRLALELGWEALEDAAIAPLPMAAAPVGVFVGAIRGDYATLADRLGVGATTRHTLTGLSRGLIANRLSYALGLTGPSMIVDAAQASSLVAVHLACESIRRGESRLALAGGVHLNLDPLGGESTLRLGALSPDGRCHTFDARANGIVRGEGGGLVVLKPLRAAREDGDRVYCVIRGSAVNNDGSTAGLTVPRAAAQAEVVRDALGRAGLRAGDLDYVELHGTGTPVGDPIEAAGLGQALAGERGAAALRVGSAKTNIGHLEGAAGVAGLIKTALAIRRREVPASLNFDQANPEIPFAELGLEVQRALEPWPVRGELPVAGVSSFGIGGTNCHLILTGEPEGATAPASAAKPSAATVLPLSAKDEAALRDQAAAVGELLREDPELAPRDLAFSLATTRGAFGVRAATVGSDRDELLAGLDALAHGEGGEGVARGTAPVTQRAAFLFPGQGHQWAGMGRDLLHDSPLFAAQIAACEEAFAPFVDWSLTEVLGAAEGAAPEDTEIVQPALFAVMVALARLWEAHGVRPAAVLGHSQGEVAAAHVAGALSLDDAARIVCRRAQLLGGIGGKGTMLSLSTSVAEAQELLAPYGEEASLAAVNGPESMVVSGTQEALAALREVCAERRVRTQEVAVGYAAHSAQVEGLKEELLDAFAPISARSGEVPFYSTVTGAPLDTAGLDAEYWYRNARETVRFEAGTAALIEAGQRLFLEVGAHPVLAYPLGETAEAALPEDDRVQPLLTLRREEGGLRRFALAVGEAHSQGVEVDWEAFFAGEERRRVALPTYPFQRRSHWLRGGDAGPGRELAVATPVAEPGVGSLDEQAAPPAWNASAGLDLVLAEAADILGFAPGEIDRRGRFKEMGLDSLGAVELRDRLRQASGLALPRTVVFDHPTPSALADRLAVLAGAAEDAGGGLGATTTADEPIAIVGMACRYPGGVADPEGLWRLVAAGGEAVGPFPADRGWDLDRLFDGDADRGGISHAREAGFLAGAAEFDAGFFGISPREALAMDPQQRQLLEASWEALEDAGIDPGTLAGTATGVFAGVSSQDYTAGLRSAERELEGFLLTGSSPSVLSGRVAYVLGLTGPAITVDTACSSSLVATHLAARALRAGECSMALAGGATVLGSPGAFTELSRQGGLAPDGRSKPFAAAADGVGWAEGVGVLVLERLSVARERGHTVLATIRGSAVNQDGASNGLTAPNGPSQERVIGAALADAGLTPADVDAVEAHGTGTPLGDPIEAGALLAAYGAERGDSGPLRLGSVKSNIGHSQAAAGVAGVIKMVEALRHEGLPRTINLEEPTPHVDWSAGEVELLAEATPWPRTEGRPRRAGVSSFGISGTNAHLILEEAPAAEPAGTDDTPAPPSPLPGLLALPLSAKAAEPLREMAAGLAGRLRDDPGLDPADVAFTLAVHRPALDRRAVVAGSGREELLAGLERLARGEGAEGVAGSTGRPVFVFSGQGSQWPGMARGLLEGSPVFAAAVADCEEALAPFLDWSLAEVLAEEDGAGLARIDVLQPVLFAVMVALARLWESCGVRPAAVVGHSQGEIVAAHVAGALSLEDAARLVALRARAIARLTGKGGMLALALGAEEARALLARSGGEISLAAVNGPGAVVVSGAQAELADLARACEAEGVRTQKVAVDCAGHSAQVDALREEMLEGFAPVSSCPGEVPFYSTVTGGPLDPSGLDPGHWFRNARGTVLLEPAIRALAERGERRVLEISPHPVLAPGLEATLAGTEGARVLGTLRRGEGGPRRFLDSLAAAELAGVEVDWAALAPGASRVPLPTYPFRRERFWLESRPALGDLRAAGLDEAEHPLLGATIESPEGGLLMMSGAISLAAQRWLADHVVGAATILPGSVFLELALAAGERCGAPCVEELTMEAPLPLPEQGSVALRVSVAAPGEDGRREIAIHSRSTAEDGEVAEWVRHAEGTLVVELAEKALEPALEWPPPAAEPLDLEDFYEALADAGFRYGPAFQGLERAWRSNAGEVCAEVGLAGDQAEAAGRYALHPVLLDTALHASLVGPDGEPRPRLPFSWRGVAVDRGEAHTSLRVRLGLGEEGEIALWLGDEQGRSVAVGTLATRPLDLRQLGMDRKTRSLFRVDWVEQPLAGAADGGPTVVELEPPRSADPTAAARESAAAALGLVQRALAENPTEGPLLILVEGAVAVTDAECPDLAAAAAWGLIGSAQSEHPGRFALVDHDGTDASRAAVPALGELLEAGETRLALREGRALAPRLARVEADPLAAAPPLDPERTVLIAGATGGLGTVFARHLVESHGARHLLLASRSGPAAPGAAELADELRARGAAVELVSCDLGRREEVAALLAGIAPERPLGAVFHAAGALDDAVIQALGPAQIDRVFAPKVDGAWNLHEATADLDLTHFVLFSSAAATLGTPGQANYAAANAFLDALALRRRLAGRQATAIAWGLWERASQMASHLGQEDLAWLERSGLEPITDERGAELFDASLATGSAALIALPLRRARLRSLAAGGLLPPLLWGLVRPSARRRTTGGSLAAALSVLAADEREAAVLKLVSEAAAAVLGHDSAAAIEPRRAFKDMGFDSLAAVELRNQLAAATGLVLPPTLVFDHPDPTALAAHLRAQADGEEPAAEVLVGPRAADEPIAIVGMACRFPGGVRSPDGLWRFVARGGDAIGPFPADRGWDLERLFDPDPDRPGTTYAQEGGFLYDAADFDAAFFGISPREATAMDPQQRLLLEASWEALEHAGIDPGSLRGADAGVWAGVMHHDYGVGWGSVEQTDGFAHGVAGSVATGRVSYALGLTGPAITIDTACSSSLVALHQAAASLRSGECGLALAGGVTVLSTPLVFTDFSRQRGLAPDGRSKPFAAAADGAGWSEGVGVLVLERLSVARERGHSVLATIRGSAVNQDGASNGLTAPNGPAQERVIRQALAEAGLAPADVDAVEAHGTGTPLGDPIEAGALLATYGAERGDRGPLRLGSVKSNIGHPQAAAGVAGVIKMVEALRREELPRSLRAEEPTPQVDWSAGEVELLAEATPWPRVEGRPRRAGVSSFGISGTNAHLIVEEAPEAEPAAPGDPDVETPPSPLPGLLALPLSAKAEEPLREMAAGLARRLREDPALDPADVSFSLATGRALLDHRAVVAGPGRDDLLAGLEELAAGGGAVGRAARGVAGPVLLLTGQGAQRAGMGLGLRAASPAFARALEEAFGLLDPHLPRPLAEVIEEGGAALEDTTYAQPALFALEVAGARLLEAFGVRPAAMVGHSVGELAAAHLAGVLSLSDACALVAARGRLMGALPPGGAMVAIEAGEDEVAEALAGSEGVGIAAVNGPTSVVVSGDEAEALGLAARFAEAGRRTRRLAVSHAFHSPLIDPMLAELEETVRGLALSPPRVPIVSTLTGRALTDEEATDPAYWARQARGTVRFAEALAAAAGLGHRVFLELGPDPVLCTAAAGCLEEDADLIPTLKEGEEEAATTIEALAALHRAGVAVGWAALAPGGSRVALPTYPFERRRFWLAPSAAGDPAAVGQVAVHHPFLGAAVELPGDEGLLLTGRLSLAEHPWLADHAVFGTALLPGTALLELALRAGAEAGAPAVRELTLGAPMVLPGEGALALRIRVGAPEEDGSRAVGISSRPVAEPEEWTTNATGVLGPGVAAPGMAEATWPPEGAEPLDLGDLYGILAEAGFDYGPAFRCVRAAWRRGSETCIEVSLDGERPEAFAVHPALLDSSFHPVVGLADVGRDRVDTPWLPFSFTDVLRGTDAVGSLRVRISEGSSAGEISLAATDETGATVLMIDSLLTRPVDPAVLRAGGVDRALHSLAWREVGMGEDDGAPIKVVLLGDPGLDLDPDLEVLARHPVPVGPSPEAVHSFVAELLATVQAFLGDEEHEGSRLVVLTRGALAVDPGEMPDPAIAAALGLVGSAASEHPGRIASIDLDAASEEALPRALALSAEEPRLALRDGRVLAPRLKRAEPSTEEPPAPDPDRTVLVTGASGALGGLVARHLAQGGSRHLVLASRRGPEAEGAAELLADLEALGAQAEVVACDVADRESVEALVTGIDPGHPLGTVIHCAGVLEDVTIQGLDVERLDRVLAPKVDGAWNLHEATRGTDLERLVLFSSLAGVLGGPGQGNYAAANSYLDALAQARRAEGLAATSLAWGLWDEETGMTPEGLEGEARLRAIEQIRIRLGLARMQPEHGLELLDACLRRPEALLAPAPLDRASLRSLVELGAEPAVLRDLAAISRPTSGASGVGRGDLAARLAVTPAAERQALTVSLVSEHVAAVLGHASTDAVDPDRAFKDLGFDSLAAVELRNRLGAATGLRLPVGLVFDHPTVTEAAQALLALCEVGDEGAEGDSDDAEVRRLLASVPLERLRRTGLLSELLAIANPTESAGPDEDGAEAIAEMDDDELVRLAFASRDQT